MISAIMTKYVELLGFVITDHGHLFDPKKGEHVTDEDGAVLTAHNRCAGRLFDPHRFLYHAQLLVDRCFERKLGYVYAAELLKVHCQKNDGMDLGPRHLNSNEVNHRSTASEKTHAATAALLKGR